MEWSRRMPLPQALCHARSIPHGRHERHNGCASCRRGYGRCSTTKCSSAERPLWLHTVLPNVRACFACALRGLRRAPLSPAPLVSCLPCLALWPACRTAGFAGFGRHRSSSVCDSQAAALIHKTAASPCMRAHPHCSLLFGSPTIRPASAHDHFFSSRRPPRRLTWQSLARQLHACAAAHLRTPGHR